MAAEEKVDMLYTFVVAHKREKVLVFVSSCKQAAFLSDVENLQVSLPPVRAKVIINARTGSVVMNRTVTIDEAAVAYGNLSVSINRQEQVNQPDTPFAGGETVVTENTEIALRTDTGTIKRVQTSANLADVVQALNAWS